MAGLSRLSEFNKSQIIALLGALMLVIGYGLALGPARTTAHSPGPAPASSASIAVDNAISDKEINPDLFLYRAILDRVTQGEAYHAVAADEQRRGGYPLKPFVTMRLPTLAVAMATVGPMGATAVLWGLMAATLLVWWRRLDGAFSDPGRRVTAIMLLVSGLTLIAMRNLIVVHDIWAGLLIALAFGLHDGRRWGPAFIAVAAAVAVRETMLPIAALFLTLALWEKRWREGMAWVALMAVAGLALWFHAQAVAAVTFASDPPTQGWVRMGGWSFVLHAVRGTTALRALPEWVAAIAVPLSFLGWLTWRSRTGLAVSFALVGYSLLFMTAGRTENFYWGLWIAPTLLMGLAFIPQAFSDLRAAWAKPRPSVLPDTRRAPSPFTAPK